MSEENAEPALRARKDHHLDLVLAGAGETAVSNGFDRIRFAHCALPEIALADIDLSLSWLGRRLNAPLLISSMTGGPARAEAINRNLAEAAQTLGIALAVGSQRVALEGAGGGGLGSSLRRAAPDLPILSNLGAVQMRDDPGLAARAVEALEADALIIHLNPLQEALQPEGDTDWRGVLAAIEETCRTLAVPVVVKEVGAGINGRTARQLWEAGVRHIDVAGAGGTSWAAIEAGRARTPQQASIAAPFRDWGIPTATALQQVRAALPDAFVIASGGIRDGLDVAKALRLGANLVGQAAGVLQAAMVGPEAVFAHFETVIAQLRIAAFAAGSANLDALRDAPLISVD